MDLRNTDLTPDSNDPAQYTQSKCAFWDDGQKESPCRTCPDIKTEKKYCQGTRDRCPGGRRTTEAELEGIAQETEKRNAEKRVKKPCKFPGCEYETTGQYCVWHGRRITSRINKYKIRFGKNPPDEYTHLPFSTNGKRHNLIEVFKSKYGFLPYESKVSYEEAPSNSIKNNRRIKFIERYGFRPCDEYLNFPVKKTQVHQPLVPQFEKVYGKPPWPHEDQSGIKGNAGRKLTDEQVRFVRHNSTLPRGERIPLKVLAEKYGMAVQTLSSISTGKFYKHVGKND